MRTIDADQLSRAFCPGETYRAGEIQDVIDAAPTIGDWISVKDRLPEEHDSLFAKFHDTELWSRAMWLKESETVLVCVAFPDGGQKVTVGRLHDGKWSTTVSQVISHTVTRWMPMPPEPPKEADECNTD